MVIGLLGPLPPAMAAITEGAGVIEPRGATSSWARWEWGAAEQIGTFPFSEGSGVVASRVHDGIVWAMRDSGPGDREQLYAFRVDDTGAMVDFADGKAFHTITIDGPSNLDWEDIAVDDDGNVWLADTGNNSCTRPNRRLLRLPEPDPHTDTTATVDGVFEISWPDARSGCTGRDAESLFFVDSTPYLIRKAPISGIYRVTSLHTDRVNPLVEVAELATPSTATQGFKYLTGADLSADGSRLLVTSRGNGAWIYQAEPAGGDPDQVVARLAADDPAYVPGSGGNEGVALHTASSGVLLLSESGPLTLGQRLH